jgi:hypothetical protein
MAPEVAYCDTHAWASVGVADRDGTLRRIWVCENCPAWTGEPLRESARVDWPDTWLSDT